MSDDTNSAATEELIADIVRPVRENLPCSCPDMDPPNNKICDCCLAFKELQKNLRTLLTGDPGDPGDCFEGLWALCEDLADPDGDDGALVKEFRYRIAETEKKIALDVGFKQAIIDGQADEINELEARLAALVGELEKWITDYEEQRDRVNIPLSPPLGSLRAIINDTEGE